jgi:hypothetical protein
MQLTGVAGRARRKNRNCEGRIRDKKRLRRADPTLDRPEKMINTYCNPMAVMVIYRGWLREFL